LFGQGEPLAVPDKVRLFELPLNAGLDDVVGGLDERAAAQNRFRIRRGLLAQADNQLLYIDEVNLLPNLLIDAILDASAQGQYTVRRGPVAATYFSRFVLIGSMNPEEGSLRPQILDRFGLRITVDGLDAQAERLEAYRRVRAYQTNPRMTAAEYAGATELVRLEIQEARERLPGVRIDDEVARLGLTLIERLDIASLRAELTLFEAARAYAASDSRMEVAAGDLWAVAPMALRLRQSRFMRDYLKDRQSEEAGIRAEIANLGGVS
jgi:magnesium chelatase subunit I